MVNAKPNPNDFFEADDGHLLRRIRSRTADFLQAYPPKEGWGLLIESEQAGVDLVGSCGAHVVTMRYRAELVGPDGRVRATASKLFPIDGYTSFERGETGVRHRIYDALGIAGAIDNDELEGQTARSAGEARPVAVIRAVTDTTPTAAKSAPEQSAEPEQPAEPDVAGKADADAQPASAQAKPSVETKPQDSGEPADNPEMLETLHRQIQLACQSRGLKEENRTFNTTAEAAAHLRELLKR